MQAETKPERAAGEERVVIDLHTHSTASDGCLTPAALVRAAADAGVKVLALTDHDTIDGLDEAAAAAKTAGIKFLRGVELEIDWPEHGAMEKREFHLLGLGLGAVSSKLKRILFELRHNREERNESIITKMHELGIAASIEEIRNGANAAYIGRPHFADFLIRKKIAKNAEAAFRDYLAKGKPLYAPKGGVTLKRAIAAIKESDGCAVLAHPTSLYIAWGRFPELFEQCKDAGLDGIEAWHPIATEHEARRLVNLAETFGFSVSAGSDFHGDRRDRRLARGPNGILLHSGLCSGVCRF